MGTSGFVGRTFFFEILNRNPRSFHETAAVR